MKKAPFFKEKSTYYYGIRIFFIFLLITVFFIILPGCGKSAEEKAKELISAGMYEQAKVFLKEKINNEPTNENLHYLLGKCYLASNEIPEADKAFERVIKIDIKKSKLVGKSYFEEGKVAFDDNKIEKYKKLFNLSYKYDPSLGKKISNIYEKK